MKVSAVVVSHGHSTELARSLPALLPQVDEMVVVANLPGSAEGVPDGVRVLENSRPLPLAANVNLAIAATKGEYVLNVNPDAITEEGAVPTLTAFADAHARCGIAGPQMLWPDGTWQPSRRRFPTVRGTIVRRTPLRLESSAHSSRGSRKSSSSTRSAVGRFAVSSSRLCNFGCRSNLRRASAS